MENTLPHGKSGMETPAVSSPTTTAESKTVSPPKAPLDEEQFVGCQFVFLRNSRMRFFIPSTKNYFGGFQVKTCLHNSGCSSHLIGLQDIVAVDKVLTDFTPSSRTFLHDFVSATGVTGTHVVWTIKNFHKDMDIRLCTDLFPQNSKIHVEHLRFYLCSEHIEHLLRSPSLTVIQKAKLTHLQSTVTPNTKCRKHTLIGQDILKKFPSISFENVIACVIPGQISTNVWDVMESLQLIFLGKEFQALLPTDFNSLESDDFVASDDCFTED
jgi:hypothetical protein